MGISVFKEMQDVIRIKEKGSSLESIPTYILYFSYMSIYKILILYI